jgi:hypothetical protein
VPCLCSQRCCLPCPLLPCHLLLPSPPHQAH